MNKIKWNFFKIRLSNNFISIPNFVGIKSLRNMNEYVRNKGACVSVMALDILKIYEY